LKIKDAKIFLALLPSASATLETSVNKYEHGIACPPYCPAKERKKEKKKKKCCLNHLNDNIAASSLAL
jgi:hypothetical protein